MMIQLLSGMNFHHSKGKYFEINELIEQHIFIKSDNGQFFVDPYFYADSLHSPPSYFIIPEVNASKKSDIFILGLIFFRVATLHSHEKIEEIIKLQKKSFFKMKTTLPEKLKSELLKSNPVCF
jgi:hypothetical protein